MNKLFKFTLSKSIYILPTLVILMTPFFVAHATWDGNPYTPNQTLDPECAPTDPNCTVTLGFTTSGNTTTFINASTTELSVSGTASTSNLVVSNSFTLGRVSGFLKATAGVVTSALVNLAADVTGVLPQANGGTGFATYTPGSVLYADGTGNLQRLSPGSNGQVLKLAGGIPGWGIDLVGSGGGGGGSESIFATSTGLIYTLDSASVVVLGGTSTSTRNSALEVMGREYVSSGVSIATTSSTAALAVQGNANISGNISATNASTTQLSASGNIYAGQVINNGLSADTLVFANSNKQETSATIGSGLVFSGGTLSLAFSTTTANLWSSLQTFNGGITTTGTVTLGSLSGVLKAASGVVSAGTINLASEVAGILPVINGGTGWANIQSGAIPYGNGTGALATTTAGTNGQVLTLIGGVPTWTATTTAGTGLTYSSGAFTVDATQNISNLSNLSTNGFVKTINSDGTLSIDTNTYLTDNQTVTLSGDISGSGTTAITTTIGANKVTNSMLAQVAANSILANPTSATGNLQAVATSSLGIAISDTTGTLNVARGGTGVTSFTAGQLVYGSGTGSLQSIATSSVAAGTGISLTGTPGALVGGTSLVVSLSDTGVNATSYGSSTAIPTFTVDAQGRLTAASTAVVIAPAGTLSGTTLASGVIASSLTSVGTLTGLAVSGDSSFANASSTNEFSGRLTANTAAFGGTGSTTVSSTGALNTPSLTVGTLNGLLYGNSGALTVASVSSPLSFSGGILSILNAAADGLTKGAAAFAANDFDATSGLISLDYVNGQKASGSQPGFLSSSDWTIFNNKQSALSFLYPILNTANTISLAFGTTTANSWNALQQFTANASTTQFTSTGATFLATTGGNVGIGTTSPYGLLSINPNGLTGPSFVIGSSSATSLVVNANGQLSVGTTTAIGLVNLASPGATNQLVLMRNDNGNKWGIGVSGNGTLAFGYNTSLTGNINNNDVKYYADTLGDFVIGTSTVAAASAGSARSRFYVWGAGTGNNEIFQLVNNASTTIARFLDNGTGYFGGNIGIGTTSPATKLEVGGVSANVTFDGYLNCTGFTSNANGLLACTASDQRLKEDIQSLDGSSTLAALSQLNPVSFYWKPEANRTPQQQFGLIAQDVQKIFPNLVSTSSPTVLTPNGTLTVNYDGLFGPIIQAVKELYAGFNGLAVSITTKMLHSDTVVTKTLCVGSTCVTEDQLKVLLQQSGQQAAAAAQAQASVPQTEEASSAPEAETDSGASDTTPVHETPAPADTSDVTDPAPAP